MKQADVIKNMSSSDLRRALYLSQILFLIISGLLSLFLFERISFWLTLFSLNIKQIVLLGLLPGVIIVIIEVLLSMVIPKHHFDDGGINEKVFKHQSLLHIFFIAFIVAVAEELLFRGVIQTVFGFVFASSLFVIVHYRYLRKPILLVLITIVSFLIGYLFELTSNLFVTITFHFIVDFLLGIYIKYRGWGV